MDQLVQNGKSTAARLKECRLVKGYSCEDLSIATGLTVAEIEAAEDELRSPPAAQVERIEHALRLCG
jgi:transcriptional regulator with XRE-family HTH domain